tara:strand:- start:2609 stop:4048 length:1440 start_codon:yes stop_codon:yes gene_type:complete
MNKIFLSKQFVNILMLFLLLIGVILRFYNLEFENLWFDEMASFYVSDPKISFLESYYRNNSVEGTPFLFNFFLKTLHQIFGYSPNVGRYFSSTVSVISILTVLYLYKTFRKDKSYLFLLFLVSFNIFLIKFSQEARVYSLMFFLCSITLIFFFKSLNEFNSKKKFTLNSLLYTFFQILSILSHPFSLIIFFSLIFYLFVLYKSKKKINTNLTKPFFILILFIFFYLPFYIINTEPYPGWISQPDLKFYTNFFFSKFFGSRILGFIHLVVLIILAVKFKSLFSKNNSISIFIYIIFFSYLLPIVYGYIYSPILADRYIIFVLIPILFLITYLTFQLKNKTIRYLIILLISLTTIGNHFTESTFKQFFDKKLRYKPAYEISLREIDNSNYKNFSINLTFTDEKKDLFKDVILNYFQELIKKNKFKINEIKKSKMNKNEYFWSICLTDLNKSQCDKIDNIDMYEIIKEKNFNSLNLKLIKIN